LDNGQGNPRTINGCYHGYFSGFKFGTSYCRKFRLVPIGDIKKKNLYSKDSPFFSLMRRGKIVGSLNTSKLFV
jgi:hypothetical protein